MRRHRWKGEYLIHSKLLPQKMILRTRCVTLCFLVLTLLVSNLKGKKHKRPQFCEELKSPPDGSFLWEISRIPPSYFFGTIHVPYSRVWEHVPENAKKALQAADNVFFELDLTDALTVASLTSCQLLPKDDTLSLVLPVSLLTRLKRHLAYVRSQMRSWVTEAPKGHTMSASDYADYLFKAITGNWFRKRPVWVMVMVNSLTRSDIQSRGTPVLDLYLAQEAKRMGKRTGAVERVEEQCDGLNALHPKQGIFALEHTLSALERVRKGVGLPLASTENLIRHYNCGALDHILITEEATQASALTVPHLGNASLPPSEAATANLIDSYFRQELILKRNRRMGERVSSILKANPDQSFFFAFGAGHFIGEESVLDVLYSHGINTTHVTPDMKIKRRHRKRGGFVPEMKVLKNFSLPSNVKPDDQLDDAFARFLSQRRNENSHSKDSDATPSTSAPRRSFNDLWVRMDNSLDPSHVGPYPPEEDDPIDESLRVWYGLPTTVGTPRRNSAGSMREKSTPISVLIYLFVLRTIPYIQ